VRLLRARAPKFNKEARVSQAGRPNKNLAMIVNLCALTAISLGCGSQPRDIGAIRHTVVIIKENRTFDHYFGLFPGADGATSGKVSSGGIVPLTHLSDPSQLTNLCNGWDCALEAMDSGKLDKFDLIAGEP
jgi:phospholipase C